MGYTKKIKVIDDGVICLIDNDFENFKLLRNYDCLLFENVNTQIKYIEYEKKYSNQ